MTLVDHSLSLDKMVSQCKSELFPSELLPAANWIMWVYFLSFRFKTRRRQDWTSSLRLLFSLFRFYDFFYFSASSVHKSVEFHDLDSSKYHRTTVKCHNCESNYLRSSNYHIWLCSFNVVNIFAFSDSNHHCKNSRLAYIAKLNLSFMIISIEQ